MNCMSVVIACQMHKIEIIHTYPDTIKSCHSIVVRGSLNMWLFEEVLVGDGSGSYTNIKIQINEHMSVEISERMN